MCCKEKHNTHHWLTLESTLWRSHATNRLRDNAIQEDYATIRKHIRLFLLSEQKEGKASREGESPNCNLFVPARLMLHQIPH